MPDSKYCYPNTNVLKNKLNITDQTNYFNKSRNGININTIKRVRE